MKNHFWYQSQGFTIKIWMTLKIQTFKQVVILRLIFCQVSIVDPVDNLGLFSFCAPKKSIVSQPKMIPILRLTFWDYLDWLDLICEWEWKKTLKNFERFFWLLIKIEIKVHRFTRMKKLEQNFAFSYHCKTNPN